MGIFVGFFALHCATSPKMASGMAQSLVPTVEFVEPAGTDGLTSLQFKTDRTPEIAGSSKTAATLFETHEAVTISLLTSTHVDNVTRA